MRAPEAGRSGPLARPVLTAFTLLAFLLLCGLGVWQVQRLQWKTDLLARMQALAQAPAQPLEAALLDAAGGRDVDYTRVVFDCPGLDSRPFLRLHAIDRGVAGHRIISKCALEPAGAAEAPYDSILVDRGFVTETERVPEPGPAAEHRPVVGVLGSPTPNAFAPDPDPRRNVWYAREIASMAPALGASKPAPVFVFLESPPPPGGLPRPSPLPTGISNRHLGYAITWFGLAAALLGVYAAVMFKDRSPQ